MFNFRSLASLFLICSLCVFATSALALSLEQAKTQGLVGEQPSGYLGIRIESLETKNLVDDINSRRKAEYTKIAAKNNTSIDSVEALAGQKAVAATPKGQYVLDGSSWVKK